MAHYAFLDDNNTVVEVITGRDPGDVPGMDWEVYYGAKRGMTCKRTSYNTQANLHRGGEPFRYNYAGIGYTFDDSMGANGAFIPPQPYTSWVLRDDATWEAPVPMPADGKQYAWDEDSQSWVDA
jgi:hypothetical protein